MLLWVLKELNALVFNFFWRGERELVARSSVVKPFLFEGFSVIDVKLKVQSLVLQWIKHFASSSLLDFFYGLLVSFCLNLSPLEVLSDPYGVAVRDLPLFYQSLILAWRWMALIPPLGFPLLWPLAIPLLLHLVCLLSPAMCICCPSVTLLPIASSSHW